MMRLRPLATALLLACAPFALAQPAEPVPAEMPTEQPPAAEQVEAPALQADPEPTLILRELIVLQTDRYGDTANNPKLIPTTLFNPIRHKGRAKHLDQAGQYVYAPMPLGLMTFEGEIDETIWMKLSLTAGRDQIHAHWPSNGITGPRSIEWPELYPADEGDRVVPITQKDDWLDPLRDSEERVWFRSRSGTFKERFLLYDASLSFKPTIQVTSTNDQYSLKSSAPEQAAPPLSMLVRKTDAGWTADGVTAPWPQPIAPIANRTSSSAAAATLSQALAPIKDLLAERGYNEQEITLALGMVAASGFESSTFSLVYVLPEGGIDKHIRLQIKPTPDEVIRTAIVVVNNVDPDLGSQVNALLDDLGSDQWLKRDRAQRELINLGQAAIKKVQQLTDHQDPEIAFRARQILDAHDWKMNGNK